ncbi:MAG: tRNA guanosine(34) transglycosylase Tgt [Candidatus Saccharibacteria bacterium]
MSDFKFKIITKIADSLGRAGEISTAHGTIRTPAFIVVGTKATVKALTPEQIKATGAQAVLANAYHLYLQPGPKVIGQAGGLAKFMNWPGPTFSDSGGFQVLSLGAGYKKVLAMGTDIEADKAVAKKGQRLASIDDYGANFKSHIDGSKHRFTPKLSMQIQHSIGADIIFAFDECTSIMQSYVYQKIALERTHQWAKVCLKEHNKLNEIQTRSKQALYGVIQGAHYQDLRQQSAIFMANLAFDGYGLGGAFEKENLAQIIKWVNEILPENKPKHLLGLSEPDDIFIGIENGADTFDCVSPARIARNGSIYTTTGRFTIKKAQFADDYSPLVNGCNCYTCTSYSKAYINHLFRSGERLAATLATIHNEYFIVQLVDEIRESIINGTFQQYKKDWLSNYYG